MEKAEAERLSLNGAAAMFLIALGAENFYLLVISLFGWEVHHRQNPCWLSAFSVAVATLVFILASYNEKYRVLAAPIGFGPVNALVKWLICFLLMAAGFIALAWAWQEGSVGFLMVIALASQGVGLVCYSLVHRRAATT